MYRLGGVAAEEFGAPFPAVARHAGMTERSTSPTGHHAFVSYASPDAAIANTLVDALERQGISCWIAPRDVVPGTLYADAIVRAINRASAFVLVLSEHAVHSAHVGKEIERASSKGVPIIAVRTDAAPLSPSFEYFLSESQWIDVASGGLHDAVATVVTAMQEHSRSMPSAKPRVQPNPLPRAQVTSSRRRVWSAVLLAVTVTVSLAWLATERLRFTGDPDAATAAAAASGAPRVSEKSIAVLPFVDMSEKQDQGYLAEGMAEEIINLLAQVPDLHVPARTSSFYFKDTPTKIADIARELGVAQILEGSVRLSGNRLRVTVKLARADTGYQLWSETYDRDLEDVFAVQDSIANATVEALQIKLMGG